ncbi:TRAP-type C4-dicarboxylate transport system permease small subunit [Pseudaminobacter salicylatoxidans]|uniref:TRAP transporter small permease protein n=1 Tax=Pseudaminobacter salicylatoxidans TaxID=93369 RepID=A0A316C8I0_PSESE|nr:TRAP transporter small permease [Pseudaminobacter salicylatoxidans]PWJ84327.1 TRAP-type C4-dicarboxylate transport system permease small subunit [Pseudaminobacter salicylatoxidans]
MHSAVGEKQGRLTSKWEVSQLAARSGRLLHTVLGIALLFVVGVNVVNASGRYLFGFSMTGTDELMVYTLIWVVMAGAILSLAKRDHISVNLLPSYAKGRAKHLLHVVHDAAAVFACAYVTYASDLFVGKISRLGTKSMGLGVPMSVPHTALLVGFAGLTLVGAFMLVRDIGALLRNDPHREPAA